MTVTQAPFYIEERLSEDGTVVGLFIVNPNDESDKIVIATIDLVLLKDEDLHRKYVELLGSMVLVKLGLPPTIVSSSHFAANTPFTEVKRAASEKVAKMNANEVIAKASGK
jgi:hypothetical protein